MSLLILIAFTHLSTSLKTSFGISTAAYQIEGGVSSRGQHMWDIFSHIPGKVHNNETGDIADDSYGRWEEDLDLVYDLGVSFYRFSFSWSRLFPTRQSLDSGVPSEAGKKYYDDIINSLCNRGVKPFVTLYHWDLPVYTDWLNKEQVVKDFGQYARMSFKLFGSRLTLNEPWTYTVQGYDDGQKAPGRCSDRSRCEEGDSATECYIAAHNSILAHATAYDIYHNELNQDGKIGMTVNMDWAEPYTLKAEDIYAAERDREFSSAWFMDPIYFGDYPKVMREYVGHRLPVFTEEEKKLVTGSCDFFGLNSYTTHLTYYHNNSEQGWLHDAKVTNTQTDKHGNPIGPRADSEWLYVVPWGIRKVVKWVSDRYGYPDIYICENGVDVPNEGIAPLPGVLNDTFRIDFYKGYLDALTEAVEEDDVKIKGYMAWSLEDNYEWQDGYSRRFGMVYIDRNDDLKRLKKASFEWYKGYVKENQLS